MPKAQNASIEDLVRKMTVQEFISRSFIQKALEKHNNQGERDEILAVCTRFRHLLSKADGTFDATMAELLDRLPNTKLGDGYTPNAGKATVTAFRRYLEIVLSPDAGKVSSQGKDVLDALKQCPGR